MFNRAQDYRRLENTNELVYTIREDTTPWDIAKFSLEMCNANINDETILEELYRLVEANGCTRISDFIDKFKVGNAVKIKNENVRVPRTTSFNTIGYISSNNK